jgi:hypothetical protein
MLFTASDQRLLSINASLSIYILSPSFTAIALASVFCFACTCTHFTGYSSNKTITFAQNASR